MCIYATRFIKNINTGVSRPVLLEANDRKKYDVKLLNNATRKVLINDFICSKLGVKLQLPVPECEEIFISKDLIDMENQLNIRNITEGSHFASLFYEDVIGFVGENTIKSTNNINEIPGIIAFDLWVGNDDRCDNKGNLLIATNEPKILAIDFGNAFNGPDWIEDDLIFDDIMVPGFDGSVYSCLKMFVSGNNPFNNICDKIEGLSYDDIKNTVYKTPSNWGVSERDKEQIAQF